MAKCCVVSAFDRRDYIEELQAWGVPEIHREGGVDVGIHFLDQQHRRGSLAVPAAQPHRTRGSVATPADQAADRDLELVRAGLSSKQIAGALNVTGRTVTGAAMTDKATQDEREAFEKWGNAEASDEDVVERALLNHSTTQFHAWLAWQARAALQNTEPAPPEPSGAATVCCAVRHQ